MKPEPKCAGCGEPVSGNNARGGPHLELTPDDDGADEVTNWVCLECLAVAPVEHVN
jgi:hypothetical protein